MSNMFPILILFAVDLFIPVLCLFCASVIDRIRFQKEYRSMRISLCLLTIIAAVVMVVVNYHMLSEIGFI